MGFISVQNDKIKRPTSHRKNPPKADKSVGSIFVVQRTKRWVDEKHNTF